MRLVKVEKIVREQFISIKMLEDVIDIIRFNLNSSKKMTF